MNENQCQICKRSPAQLRYNVITCNACRTFFYRSIVFKPPGGCKKRNDCAIVPEFRGNCPSCRFQRCLALKMAMDKVGKIKKYKPTLHVHTIPHQAMVTMVACYKHLIPLDLRSESDSNILISYSRTVCRWTVSYIDFLVSTCYFNEFSPHDKEHIARNNAMDFMLFCMLECELKYGRISENDYCEQFKITYHERKLLVRAVVILNELFVKIIQPLYDELTFDEMESTAVKAIAMYSPAVELSEDGMKKAAFARDAFTLKLMEHIEATRPELTRHQQLDRLSKLLNIIKEVKNVGRIWKFHMAESVFNNRGGLDGRITYDIYVN